jgi:hypothetical protein
MKFLFLLWMYAGGPDTGVRPGSAECAAPPGAVCATPPPAAPEPAKVDAKTHWEASVSQTSDLFSDGRTPWYETQVQMNRRRARSTVISRFSQAQRLGRQEQQVEGDWYPVLNPKTYAYPQCRILHRGGPVPSIPRGCGAIPRSTGSF